MTQTEVSPRFREMIRREWLVVVAAAVIGIALAFAVARSETTTQWKSTQLVTVASFSGGLSNASKAEIFVTAVSTPSVLRAAEDELGVARGTLNGDVSSQVVTADKSTVSISVTAGSEDDAEARVKTVTATAVDYVLAPYEGFFAIRDETATASVAREKEIRADIKRLEKVAATVPAADRWGYFQALVQAKEQLFAVEQAGQAATQGADLIRASVYIDPEPKTGSSSSGGLQVAAILQGLLLGVVAGVLVALVREWLRARRARA